MARVFKRIVLATIASAAVACSGNNPQKDTPVVAKTAPELVAGQSAIGAPGEGVINAFTQRVKEYMALQQQLDGTLDKLPANATPLQIDAHQRALGALIAKGRPDARQGAIFEPEMQKFVRAVVRRVISGPDGAKIKASLMDENPMGVKIVVNDRYPDTIPLSTMPPEVLSALPKLPVDVEYRFVGNRLILLDTKAHLIVDFVDNTFDL